MNGAHRSTAQRPVASALKSAAWLLTGAALITVLLAFLVAFLGLLALVIDVPIAHRTDVRLLTIAVLSATSAAISGHLTRMLFRKRARSPGPEMPPDV
jgi:hypothetical protein